MLIDAVFWGAGALFLPLFPILAVAVALKALARPLTVHAVLEDGVLFFYSATIAAALLMDLARHAVRSDPAWDRTAQGVYAAGVLCGVFLLLWSTLGFSIAALGRAGARGEDQRPFELRWLFTLSWISAASAAILSLGCHLSLRLF